MSARVVLAGIAGLLLLVGLAWFADNYVLRLATTVGMYAALALSWNLIGGLAGYPSFATGAFFGLGAYALAIGQSFGMPFGFALIVAAIVGAGFAALLGGAILHLRGHYFAIASLVVADVLREVTNSWTDVTGGGMGINLPFMSGSVDQQVRFYFAVMVAVALAGLVITWIVARSRLGVALRCIEQNEDAAPTIGIATARAKVAAFTLSGMVASATGGVYASWVTYIDPTDVYDVLLAVKPIVMVLIGGVGTIFGPVIGAFVFLVLEEVVWRNLLEFHSGILGLLVVALVLFLPGGLRDLRRFHLGTLLRGFRRREAVE